VTLEIQLILEEETLEDLMVEDLVTFRPHKIIFRF
jgi:hypothetical protein